jgi:hypothetical protein
MTMEGLLNMPGGGGGGGMTRPPVQLIKPRCVTKHVPLLALSARSGFSEAMVIFVSPAAAEMPAWRGEEGCPISNPTTSRRKGFSSCRRLAFCAPTTSADTFWCAPAPQGGHSAQDV